MGVCGEGSFCLADLHRQLASHVSPRLISNQHRPAHTHVQKHTHILYPSLKRLCSLMPRLDFLSPSFPLPPPLPFRPFGHLCVVRYRQYLLKNCAAVSGLKRETLKNTVLPSQVNLITCLLSERRSKVHRKQTQKTELD